VSGKGAQSQGCGCFLPRRRPSPRRRRDRVEGEAARLGADLCHRELAVVLHRMLADGTSFLADKAAVAAAR